MQWTSENPFGSQTSHSLDFGYGEITIMIWGNKDGNEYDWCVFGLDPNQSHVFFSRTLTLTEVKAACVKNLIERLRYTADLLNLL